MALATGSAGGPVAGAGTLIAPGKMVLPRFGASTTTVPASRCGLGRNDLEADLIRNGRPSACQLCDGFRVDPVALRQRPQARLTMLYRSTDCLCRRGAPMKNLAHSASFESFDKDAPSKPGTKHLPKGFWYSSNVLSGDEEDGLARELADLYPSRLTFMGTWPTAAW